MQSWSSMWLLWDPPLSKFPWASERGKSALSHWALLTARADSSPGLVRPPNTDFSVQCWIQSFWCGFEKPGTGLSPPGRGGGCRIPSSSEIVSAGEETGHWGNSTHPPPYIARQNPGVSSLGLDPRTLQNRSPPTPPLPPLIFIPHFMCLRHK